jgi:hypothetical protein
VYKTKLSNADSTISNLLRPVGIRREGYSRKKRQFGLFLVRKLPTGQLIRSMKRVAAGLKRVAAVPWEMVITPYGVGDAV